MTRIFNRPKAFTLVELALVIGIIGQLAAFAITESMSMMGDVEEAMLDNYYQQLQNGYGKYVAEMGKRPKRFEDFVVPSKVLLDPSNGKAMTILFDKDNKPACWYNLSDPNAGDNTLTCIAGNVTKSAIKRRAAIFSFKTGTGMMLQKKMLYSLTIP
jgi:prepilin-type N-terminal cleavage/methylation domain-containing protein